MRTSYVPKNKKEEQPQVTPKAEPSKAKQSQPVRVKPPTERVNQGVVNQNAPINDVGNNAQEEVRVTYQSPTSVSLSDVYRDIQEEIEFRESMNPQESTITEIPDEPADTPNTPEPKKSSGSIVWVIICIILGIALVGIVGANLLKKSQSTSVEDLATGISKLYTSNEKNDILDGVTQEVVQEYYTKALELQNNGRDVTGIVCELDTISYYIQDKGKLLTYKDSSYNLDNPELSNNLDLIRSNLKSYTVTGLAVSITDMITEVSTYYNSYTSLRLELQGISDVLNFDEEKYQVLIDAVPYSINREELQGIFDTIVAKKETKKAEEAVKKAEDEEAKAKAEKALNKAKKQQKKTQKALDDVKNKLEELINNTQAETENAGGEEAEENVSSTPETPAEETSQETQDAKSVLEDLLN